MSGIDRVISDLDGIIEWSCTTSSCLGYFPALYRRVTATVQEGIAQNAFDDGARMEQLDVIFADRYLAAIEAHRRSAPVTEAWLAAFEACGDWSPIVLQHLLLGINAHINLDLGIAAAQTAGRDGLPALRNDFNRINGILAAMVGTVQEELTEIWPTLRVFSGYLGNSQTVVINFSMEKARDCAWQVAEELAPLGPEARDAAIARLDHRVAALANVVRKPGPVLGTVTRIVRLGERGTVPEKIQILR
jgi:hypothetical protein